MRRTVMARQYDRARGSSSRQVSWYRRPAMRLKDLTRRALGRGRRPRPPQTWSRVEDNPPDPEPLHEFAFFAVLGTWMEDDVVGACVQNAMAQGCERVFLVDNDSPDDTVEKAIAAGAELARTFSTEHYDENLRMKLMNEVVEEVSRTQEADHVWWLWLDADEFAHGPRGLTLRQYLEQLDRRFRLVGTTYFNHYPSTEPHYVPDRHPLDFQPLCELLAPPFCMSRHRKHPLQRWDRDGPQIVCEAGFHRAFSAEKLTEPTQGAFLHHFPFREEKTSRARLEALCGRERAREDDPATAHMLPRYRSLAAVYEQRWDDVENFMPGKGRGVSLRPWTELVEPADRVVKRWYPHDG